MSDKRHTDPIIRRSQRVLLMVHELHKLGYQKLRIMPGMSSSGGYWRCSITHIGNILKSNGTKLKDFDKYSAHYTTGQDNVYFGWEDARRDTARQLAAKFIERFPDIAEKGKGADWMYAGWYVQMLGFAEKGELPVAYADWYDPPDPAWLPTIRKRISVLPYPPGGEAEDGDC